MEAKRFTAGDMRRALQMVREHLGPDAVILSSRKNIDGVEVVATNDYRIEDQEADQIREIAPVANKIYRQLTGVVDTEVSAKRQDKLTLSPKIQAEKTMRANVITTPAPVAKARPAPIVNTIVEPEIDEPEEENDLFYKRHQWDLQNYKKSSANRNQDLTQDITKMRSEIDALRSMLSSQPVHAAVSTGISISAEPQTQVELKQRLGMMGIPATQFDYYMKDISPSTAIKSAWREVLRKIQSQIKIASRDLVNGGGVFAFVGPTGAGKTTTIAKLATRYAMQHGVEHVGLISLDTQRVGGTQQLKTMSKLLGIPVRMVDSASELEVSLRAFRSRSLVLIDTAGVRPGSAEMTKLLKILQVDKIIESFLVIPTTCQYPVMKTQLHCYRDVAKGIILTKLDEAVSLGEAFAAIVDGQLPLAYTTDGQLIPENIALPNLQELMSLAVDKIRDLKSENRDEPKNSNKKSFAVSDLYSK